MSLQAQHAAGCSAVLGTGHSAQPHPHDAVKVEHVALGLADGLPPLEAAPVRQALGRLIAGLEVCYALPDVPGCIQQLRMPPHAVQLCSLCSWQKGPLRMPCLSEAHRYITEEAAGIMWKALHAQGDLQAYTPFWQYQPSRVASRAQI